MIIIICMSHTPSVPAPSPAPCPSMSQSAVSADHSSSMDLDILKQQELAEKKKRRLERNRASARQCRKRKKEKKLMLRQQLAHLEADNLQLRLKLQVGDETNNDQSTFITSKLNEMLTEGATESDIQKTIQELQERFSDYGRDRRSAIDFHIAQLRRCLQPTQTTRAILWLMSLAPKYHDPITGDVRCAPTDELSSLWHSLLEEVRPDSEQKKIMMSYTIPKSSHEDPFLAINNATDTCNKMLDRIVEIVCNKNDSLDQEMANIQHILSARQTAKFILWIDRNPACMQMLEALWPHITYAPHSSSNGNLSHSGDLASEESEEDSSNSEAD
jgi:hypothetical protein